MLFDDVQQFAAAESGEGLEIYGADESSNRAVQMVSYRAREPTTVISPGISPM